jgi:hypothetical protein
MFPEALGTRQAVIVSAARQATYQKNIEEQKTASCTIFYDTKS